MSVYKSSRRSRSALCSAVIEPLESRQLLSATLYAFTTDGGSQPSLLKVDTATGTATNLGAFTSNNLFSEGPLALAGTSSGTLYALDGIINLTTGSDDDELDTIDPSTAAVAQDIGTTGSDNFNLAATPTNALYAINSADALGTALVSIDPSTGASTVVGSTNLSAATGLSSDGSTGLYVYTLSSDSFEGELASLNPTTAVATPIGLTGLNTDGVRGLALGSDGVLYGYDTTTNKIVSFSTTTGAATVVSTLTGASGLADLTSFIQPSSGGTGGGGGTTASPLTPTVGKSTVPTSVIGGAKPKGHISISLTNSSATLTTGTTTISLFVTTTGEIDSTSENVGTLVLKKFGFKPGVTVQKTVNVTKLPTMADQYTLLAQVTDGSGNVSDAKTGPTLSVVAPFVSLSATVDAVKPTAPKLGKPASFVVTITNAGNVDSTGMLKLAVGLSSDGATLAEAITTLTFNTAKIKAGGKPTKLTAHFTSPADLNLLAYYPLVTIMQGTNTLTASGPMFSLAVGTAR